jgi:hypothetical protein
MLTTLPDTVQTAGVLEAKPTARPELAVASAANGGVPKIAPLSAPKVMVCAPGLTVKLCDTGVAAE